MRPFRPLLLSFLALLISACGTQAIATQAPLQLSPFPTKTSAAVLGTRAAVPRTSAAVLGTSQPMATPAVTEAPGLPQPSSCEDWQSLPVIPVVSKTVREQYQRGQASGNDSQAFSKIGDGEISAEWFFTAFDLGQGYYDPGPYQELLPVIEYFEGSFGRIGV